jgi:hypothetical protein
LSFFSAALVEVIDPALSLCAKEISISHGVAVIFFCIASAFLAATACEIDLSLAQRLKAGSLTSTIAADKSKPQETVFKLKIKGEIKIANEVKEDPMEA